MSESERESTVASSKEEEWFGRNMLVADRTLDLMKTQAGGLKVCPHGPHDMVYIFIYVYTHATSLINSSLVTASLVTSYRIFSYNLLSYIMTSSLLL